MRPSDLGCDVRRRIGRLTEAEVLTFLTVGGTGYVVDVVAFNLLRSTAPLAGSDPVVARALAVVVAMLVTYTGNRRFTWPAHATTDRRREVGMFVLFNVVGFGLSAVTLVLSHDVLGLTSRLADNLSANVVGLALGTAFRFLTYRHFVFPVPPADPVEGSPSVTAPTDKVPVG